MIASMNDDVLRAAFNQYSKEFCDVLPSKESLKKISFSEEFEIKMRTLMKRQKKPYYYLVNTFGKRVAVILVAALISLTTATFSVKALREPFVNFIVETYEKFTNLIFQKESDEPTDLNFVKASFPYIPEGFAVTKEFGDMVNYNVIYSNAQGQTIDILQQANFGLVIGADTENISYETILINSLEGIIYEKDKVTTLIFGDAKYVFTITSNISAEEIIKVAENILI